MKEPGEKQLEWKEIASNTNASSSKTVTISNLDKYSELLLTIGVSGNSQIRFLNSCIIPMSILLLSTIDVSDGYHQLEYSNNYIKGGISYLGNNKIKIYTGSNSGVRIYAR